MPYPPPMTWEVCLSLDARGNQYLGPHDAPGIETRVFEQTELGWIDEPNKDEIHALYKERPATPTQETKP